MKQLLDQTRTLMQPYLVPLTPAQRKNMLRMGDKTAAFVQKATNYAANNPSFVPAFVDMAALRLDVEAMSRLAPLHQSAQQLAIDLDSTLMAASGDAFGQTLGIFGNVKLLAKNNHPGAQVAYDDMGVRFPSTPGTGRKLGPDDGPAQ